ncbi:MAG: hypothetical protein NZ561_05120 [Phycisphaerae bacterium]|nr:hypothetical protein [Phycisphaerae bacterium]MDW8262887.1 hypothetical protein [Phycisphaerales bacterium]
MLTSTPGFYQPLLPGSPGFDAAAKRLEDKLIELRNAVLESKASREPGGPSQRSRYVISITQDELNAFLLKWAELNAVRGEFERWIRRPMVVFGSETVILAAESAAAPVHPILSLHLVVRQDHPQQLSLAVRRVQAGRVAIPAALWSKSGDELAAELERHLGAWRAGSRLDRSFAANGDALKAAFGGLLLSAIRGQPVDAVLVIPVRSDRGVLVQVENVEIAPGELRMLVRPLEAQEAEAFLQRLKGSG